MIPVVALALYFASPFLMKVRIGYFKKDQKIHYRTYHSWKWFTYSIRLVTDADYDSFQAIDRRYAKDKNHVYFEAFEMDGCEPNSFRLLHSDKGFSRDANTVFIGYKKLSNDPEHFTIFEGGYSKDRFKVYRGSAEVTGFDVESFYLFNDHPNFPADKDHICYQHKTIEGADIASFKILGKGYSKDNYHVYYLHRIKEDADPATFVLN